MNGRWMTGCLVAVLCVGFWCTEASAMYAPTVGRFLQRDPAGYVDGLGLSQYCRSNPAEGRDPDGWTVYIEGGPGGPFATSVAGGWVTPAKGSGGWVDGALQRTCPCVNMLLAPSEALTLTAAQAEMFFGNAGATTQHASRVTAIVWGSTNAVRDTFCGCAKRHGAGCKLLRELLVSRDKVLVGPARERNGDFHQRVGDMSGITWDSGATLPEALYPGVTSRPFLLLAHELGHAFHELGGKHPRPAPIVGVMKSAAYHDWLVETENAAVQMENAVGVETVGHFSGRQKYINEFRMIGSQVEITDGWKVPAIGQVKIGDTEIEGWYSELTGKGWGGLR